jgi:hypothetical protein
MEEMKPAGNGHRMGSHALSHPPPPPPPPPILAPTLVPSSHIAHVDQGHTNRCTSRSRDVALTHPFRRPVANATQEKVGRHRELE